MYVNMIGCRWTLVFHILLSFTSSLQLDDSIGVAICNSPTLLHDSLSYSKLDTSKRQQLGADSCESELVWQKRWHTEQEDLESLTVDENRLLFGPHPTFRKHSHIKSGSSAALRQRRQMFESTG